MCASAAGRGWWPRAAVTRPTWRSSRSASRTVCRLTPYCAHSSCSPGKEPENSPCSRRARRSSRTCCHSGTFPRGARGRTGGVMAGSRWVPIRFSAPSTCCPDISGGNVRTLWYPMRGREVMQVEVLSTDELGDRSYVVHDGSVAVVVDPQRDIDRVQRCLTAADVAASLILETHIHNDYVTGGYQLPRPTAARYARDPAHPAALYPPPPPPR